eukprot:SAG31_NODE_602_length_13638_cov_32.936037_17_plen_80_part_00
MRVQLRTLAPKVRFYAVMLSGMTDRGFYRLASCSTASLSLAGEKAGGRGVGREDARADTLFTSCMYSCMQHPGARPTKI